MIVYARPLKTFPLGGRCPSAHAGADEGVSVPNYSPYQNRSTRSKVSPFIVTTSEISTFSPHPSRLRRATFPRGGRFWRAKRSFTQIPGQRNRYGISMECVRKSGRENADARVWHYALRISPVRLQVVAPVMVMFRKVPMRSSPPAKRTSRPPSVRAVSRSLSLPSTRQRRVCPM